jgi:hypothetical protein
LIIICPIFGQTIVLKFVSQVFVAYPNATGSLSHEVG